MVSPTIEKELRGYLDLIPIDKQREVINFARELATSLPQVKVAGRDLDRSA
jgi:hypothetical protein